MDHIDISSSDGDSEFGTSTDSEFGTDDDDVEIVNPPATSDTSNILPDPVSTTATSGTSIRSLPGSASTTAISRTNVALRGHGETCQMVCPSKTVTGTSQGHLSSSHSSQTEEKGELHQLSNRHNGKHYIEKSEKRALPSSFGSSAPEARPNSFKSSHSSQTEGKAELHQLSNTHNEKRYIENSEKRALPSSFGSSAAEARPNSFKSSHSSQTEGKAELHQLSNTHNEKRYIENSEKRALPSSFGFSTPEAKPNSFKSSHSSQTEEKGELHQLFNRHYEKDYIEKFDKRALPSSFGSSAPEARPNSFKGSDNRTQKIDSGRSYYSAMPIVANEKTSRKYDVTYGLDNSRSRILPSSIVHGLAVSSGRHPSSRSYIDPSTFRSGEVRIGGPDETIIYREAIQDLNQPNQEKNVPDGLLSVTLLRHQKIALAWMLHKEARSHCLGGILADDQGLGKTVSMIALIQLQRYIDMNSKSEVKCIGRAEALTLDDDDDNVNNLEDSEGKKVSSDVISAQVTPYTQRPSAGTLIVCPATILRQWERELDEKVDPENKLRVLAYHGGNRTKDPSELAEYDVVLTTYAIVNKELPKQPTDDEDDGEQKAGAKCTDDSLNKKRKHVLSTNQRNKRRKGTGSDNGPLARVRWLRVVLDEAQTIKNHRTQVARACYALRAKRRWCLSGTPVQNTIDELFSYFKFLKYDPYSTYKAFHETIKGPISKDPALGYKKLQVILRNVMLRRTKDTRIKGEPIISLPKKIIRMVRVNFTKEERDFYANLESKSRSQFKAYAAAGTVRQNYANIVLLLLRLRQACDHPFLVCGFSSEAVKTAPSMSILNQLPKDKLVYLLNSLESSPMCQLCADPPEDAVVALCGHVFCHQCLLDHLEDDDYTCPVHRCNTQLSSNVVFSKASLKSCISYGSRSNVSSDSQSDWNSTLFTDTYISSKIKAAIEILKSLGNQSSTYIDLHGLSRCRQESASTGEKIDSQGSLNDNVRIEVTTSSSSQGPTKAIVFSQWTRMLNLFESALIDSELQYRRLDGSMTLSARDEAVREFNTDPEVTVMIMSLKAGNLGLNMVAASHVILLDLWWNPTTEDQAVDRAHRIGQTRPVTVSRITVENTVEDRILKLQEEKRKMVAAAFGEETAGATASRLSPEDLRFLFFGH